MDEGEITRSVIHYASPGASDQQNVIYHIYGAATEVADSLVLEAFNEYFNDEWAPQWADLAADSSQMDEVTIDVIDVNGLIVRTLGTVLVGLIGNGLGGVTAAGVAGYMLLRTLEPRSRGSKFVPGLDEGSIEQGILTPTAVADLILLTLIWGDTIDVDVIFNALRPGVVSIAQGVFREFLSIGAAEQVPAYQRRRKLATGS